jgi:ribosomal protein S17E
VNEEKKYEINDIVDNRYHYEKLQYRIVWIDHFSNRAWYLTENFEHSKNILKNYHQRYSEKFESDLRSIAIIETMLSQWIRNEHKKAKQLIQDILSKMKAEMKENDRKRFSKETKVRSNAVKELRLI